MLTGSVTVVVGCSLSRPPATAFGGRVFLCHSGRARPPPFSPLVRTRRSDTGAKGGVPVSSGDIAYLSFPPVVISVLARFRRTSPRRAVHVRPTSMDAPVSDLRAC